MGRLLPHSKAELAANIAVGARLPSAQVLCQSDSRHWHIQLLLPSTGQWRLIVFGGDISENVQMQRINSLGSALNRDDSMIRKTNQHDDAVGKITTYLIHCASRRKVELMDLPRVFRPLDKNVGYDYWNVFADNQPYGEGRGPAYGLYGIGAKGCIVLLRPDQLVAFVGALEDLSAVEQFLGRFFPDRPKQWEG